MTIEFLALLLVAMMIIQVGIFCILGIVGCYVIDIKRFLNKLLEGGE